MINTIFYFPDGTDSYNQNKGQLSERTITFVPKRDGGLIYKNGIRYGGVDEDADKEVINRIVNTSINNGDIIINNNNGGGSGSGSGTGGSSSGGTTTYIENPYADQWIRDKFASLDSLAESEETRVINYIINKDASVRNLIEKMFTDYTDLINHYLETGDPNYQAFTFGNPDYMTWISLLGHVTDNGDGTYSVNWSSILQTVSELRGEVDQILANPTQLTSSWYDTNRRWTNEDTIQDYAETQDGQYRGTFTSVEALNEVEAEDGDWAIVTINDRTTVWKYGIPVNYDLLSSALYAYIQDNYTSAGMNSTWANVIGGGFNDETRTVLEWMAADATTWAGGYWYDTKEEYDAENIDTEKYPANQLITDTAHSRDIFLVKEDLTSTHGVFGNWALLTQDSKTTYWKYSNMTYADVMTAAREYAANGEDVLREAAAGLHTIIRKNEHGDYEASAALTTYIDNGITEGLAGLGIENLGEEVVASLYTHIDTKIEEELPNSDTIATINSAISGLTTSVETLLNGTASKADLQSKADLAVVYTKEEVDGKVQTLTGAIGAASELATSAKTTFETWRDGTEEGTYGKFKADTEASLESAVTLAEMFGEFSEEELDDLKDAMETLASSGVTTSTTIQGWIDDGNIAWGGLTSAQMSSKLAGIDNSINSVNSSLNTKASKDALNGALETMASMRSDIEGVSAEVNTSVVKKSNGKIESGVSINGNLISFGSKDVPFSALNITGALIVGKIGTGELSFDKVNVSSNDIVGKIDTGAISFNKLKITGDNLVSILGSAKIEAKNIDISTFTGTNKIPGGNIDFTTGTYSITADHLNIDGNDIIAKLGNTKITATNLDLSGVSISVDMDNVKLSGISIFKTDSSVDSLINVNSTVLNALITSYDGSYAPSSSDIVIRPSKIIIGKVSSNKLTLTGMMAADHMISGILETRTITANGGDFLSLLLTGSAPKMYVGGELGGNQDDHIIYLDYDYETYLQCNTSSLNDLNIIGDLLVAESTTLGDTKITGEFSTVAGSTNRKVVGGTGVIGIKDVNGENKYLCFANGVFIGFSDNVNFALWASHNGTQDNITINGDIQ